MIAVTDPLAVKYAILTSVHRLIHVRVLVATLLIAALAAPAFACQGDVSGAPKPCEAMACCHHSAPAQSMKSCDCRQDDATQQSGLATTHNVQLIVLATVAIGPPAASTIDGIAAEDSSSPPPGSHTGSILRL